MAATPGEVPRVLFIPTRAWRRVLDLPVLVAVVTTVVALVTTAGRSGTAALPAVLTGAGASAGPAGAVLLTVSLLVGLPHGAVDLLRPEVLAPGATARHRRAVTAAYLGGALVVACCWLVSPSPTLLGLLLLAGVHFAAADDGTSRWKAGTGRPSPFRERLPGLVAAGGLPVAVPLGLHGEAVHDVLAGLSGGHASVVVTCARVCAVPVLAAAVAAVVLTLRLRRWSAAVETAALAGLFVLVTPLLAFAVYFGLWHSWRQVARMVAVDAARDRVAPSAALRAFCRTAALPTALTVAAGTVAVLAGGNSVLVVGLALVLCLTVPHSVVVARADGSLRRPRRAGHRPDGATGRRPARVTAGPPAGPAPARRPPAPARARNPAAGSRAAGAARGRTPR
ncbi:Brp/Blh family beta-carotene 15,15'-monooxygenase [Kineococcus rhizosphaerae]|uniref:Probable beta-carotene 15,15'-dioxygenase n=1 Tax=Kineococcus rhizosphaerae TaxID=559628 RepID=A0A2T0QZD8_9ACTN|nr:Brp/Blh family beta-carotene 15,15'-monooxygenase [Kineococcus rhizosphaerae]